MNLEKKWSHLEQNNFAIQEFVANKKAELNFEPVRNKVIVTQDFGVTLCKNNLGFWAAESESGLENSNCTYYRQNWYLGVFWAAESDIGLIFNLSQSPISAIRSIF